MYNYICETPEVLTHIIDNRKEITREFVEEFKDKDIERIISLKPEALLVSPFENSGGYGKLDKLHIPIIEAADYMETSPLGRAEWMKFYGMLFDKNADSLFTLATGLTHASRGAA